MKKITLSFALIIMLALTGCTSADAGIGLLNPLPWAEENAAVEEICTYRIQRYLGDSTKADSVVISHPDSYVTYTLRQGWGVKRNLEPGNIPFFETGEQYRNCALLEMEFTLYYAEDLEERVGSKDYVYQRYKGYRYNSAAPDESIPETIRAVTVFDRYDMRAMFTYRDVNVSGLEGDAVSHRLWVDYTGEYLGSKTARMQDATGKTKEALIKNGDYYDNESVFYFLRGLESVKLSSSQTFNLALPYDDLSAAKKRVSPKNMQQQTDASETALAVGAAEDEISEDIWNIFAEDTNQETKSLPCLKTLLSINVAKNKKTGPSITLYYSARPVAVKNPDIRRFLAKILIKMVSVSYDSYGALEYSQVYSLCGYSNGNA